MVPRLGSLLLLISSYILLLISPQSPVPLGQIEHTTHKSRLKHAHKTTWTAISERAERAEGSLKRTSSRQPPRPFERSSSALRLPRARRPRNWSIATLIGITCFFPVSGSLRTDTVIGTGDCGGGRAPSSRHAPWLAAQPSTSIAGQREAEASDRRLRPAPTPAGGSNTNWPGSAGRV